MKYPLAFFLVFCVALVSPIPARSQTPELPLTRLDEAHLDSLAALTAERIREAKLVETDAKVLVMDFFRNSPGGSSRLGTLLADRFSESLARNYMEMRVLDRRVLKDYLFENWTTLEDFQSQAVCLVVARQLGAVGVILGTLTERSGNIDLTLHLEGLLSAENEDEVFAWRDRTVSFPATEELHAELYQSGPNYTRTAEKIPKESGVFIAGIDGASSPVCTYCPMPAFTDAARSLRFQERVEVSVLVNDQGQVSGGIYVLKGAPFGLTAQTIKSTKNWRFRPGEKDGKPVHVRVTLEVTFQLN